MRLQLINKIVSGALGAAVLCSIGLLHWDSSRPDKKETDVNQAMRAKKSERKSDAAAENRSHHRLEKKPVHVIKYEMNLPEITNTPVVVNLFSTGIIASPSD